MLALELFEDLEGPPEPTLIDALRDFLPIAVNHLKIKKLPKIKLLRDVETEHLPSFGKFSNEDRIVHVDIENRHPNDVLRTLAHELTHYAQGEQNRLDADSWKTGSTIEDEANAEAGVIMREFNKQFPRYMELKPIVFEKWTQKYKKSINCNNPKGFSQRAHCASRRARQAGKHTKSSNVSEAQHTEIIRHPVGDWIVYLDNHSLMRSMTREIGPRLMSNLITAVAMIPNLENLVPVGGQFWIQDIKTNSSFYFKRIDVPGEPLAVRCETGIKDVPRTSKQTPVFRINAYTGPETPKDIQAMKRAKHISRFVGGDVIANNVARDIQKATWTGDASKEVIRNPATQDSKRYDRAFTQTQQLKKKGELAENFADGRGPGRPGDSQRHGIPKGATMAQLEKAAKAPGRKGQLARWQINMRRGRKK